MTSKQQHAAVNELIAKMDDVRVAIRNRMSFEHELVEALEKGALKFEELVEEMQALANRIDEDAEREESEEFANAAQ